MSRTYDNEKKPSQSTFSFKPTASFLQTRGFAPLQTDLDEDDTPRPSGYTENFLEKIINQRSTESSDTPVQPKRMNRLQTLQAKRISMIQAKLNIGEPNDKYEQEADATASKVVQQINSPTQDKSVQREAMEEEEELQMQPISSIQREATKEEEEELQMKPNISTIQRKEKSDESRPNETGLPNELKAGVENLSGYSLDDVRVHYNSPKPAQLQALAYAKGTEINIAPGKEDNLPHEAWHVVQQMQGRVTPTKHHSGVEINDDLKLETEADVMGEKAKAFKGNSNGTISRQKIEEKLPREHWATSERTVQAKGEITESTNNYGGIVQMGKKDFFVGDESRHHMHVGTAVRTAHYKDGNAKGGQINIGSRGIYRSASLQEVIDHLTGREGESGAQACIDWCNGEM
ncbi:MAG: DUF4157 domain-containing protein [Pseudanabaena sp.]